MKITKKLFTTFLAILMVVLLMPVSAKAASYSYTIAGKDGYVFTVYKIADINVDTFVYSNFASEEVKNALTTKVSEKGIDSAALLAAADALTENELGPMISTITTATAETKEVEAGVYYVKTTTMPANVKSVKNSVFALPYTDAEGKVKTTVNFNAGNKVAEDTTEIDITFTDDPAKSEILEFIGKDISFTIQASVPGSASLKLKSYAITGNMSNGLKSGGGFSCFCQADRC